MTTASEDLDEECRHGITRRFCADCNGTAERFRRERDLEVERVLKLEGWFPARYSGRCAIDNTRYEVSSPIRRKTHLDQCNAGSASYVGMCCAPEKEEE